MSEYIISQNSNDVCYAYSRGRFWRWNGSIWNESRIMTHRFELARAADKKLTPQEFLTNGAEFAPLEEYEIDSAMLDALKNAKPCKNTPVESVEEESECTTVQMADAAVTTKESAAQSFTAATPTTSASGAAANSLTPALSPQSSVSAPVVPAETSFASAAVPSFDFSALGDLSQQAADADQQFDLHYGAAQDEYLISCIYLARIHALTAKAGRYGGGTWTKWYESKGLSEGSARTMVKNGDAFNSATVAELKQLPELTRKDLNLIARSGCAAQLVEAAGDIQRVQELLAQLKAEKERAKTAEAERDKARADQLSTAKDCNRLGLKAEQEKARADKAEGERDEWKAEAEAARKQPIVGIVDKDEVARQVDALTAEAKAQARSQVEDAQRRANEAEAKYQKLQQDADGFLAPEQACEQQAHFIADSMRSMYLNWFGQACATGTPLTQMGAPLYALCGEIMSSLEDDTTINPTAAGSVEDAEREALFE